MNNRTTIPQLLVVSLPLLLLAYATTFAAPEGNQKPQTPTSLGTKAQSGPAYGIYRAIVTSRPDPYSRVQVDIPALGSSREWASPCLPVGSAATPPVGSHVWVIFEGGDTHLPVWMGVQPRS